MKWIKIDQKTGEPMKNSGTSFMPHDYAIEGQGLKYRIINDSFALRKNAWGCEIDGKEVNRCNTLKEAKAFLEGAVMADNDYDEYEDYIRSKRYDEADYGAGCPWNAPGMNATDFI